MIDSEALTKRYDGRSVIEPGNAMWCCAIPTLMVGATSAPVASPTARATASAVSASVPTRPLGPCCSVEPIGMMIARLRAR